MTAPPVRFALLLALLFGCAGCAKSALPDESQSVIDLSFFGRGYGGAQVCVEGACGVVGMDAEIVVQPAIVGTEMWIEVSRGEARVEFARSFALDVEYVGLDPETVRTHRVSMGLVPAADGTCQVYLTNHNLGSVVVGSGPPISLDTLCGPFARP